MTQIKEVKQIANIKSYIETIQRKIRELEDEHIPSRESATDTYSLLLALFTMMEKQDAYNVDIKERLDKLER